MNRNLIDKLLTVTTALPAQNTNKQSTTLDLGTGIPEAIQFEIDIPATPSLAAAQTITVKLQDSADDVTYADVAALSSVVVTGAGGGAGPATNRKVYLPPTIRRYVQLNIAASATAGDNTAVSVTHRLRF